MRVFHWSLVVGFALNALILDEESKLHEWVGYVVVALVTARIIWGVIGRGHARFADFPPSIGASYGQLSDIATGRKRIHPGHTPLGAWMIYNLLMAMLLLGLTGYMMTTTMFWGVGWVEDAHEMLVFWAEFSVILHILAVIYESRRSGVNLPRAMVTGYKTLPNKDKTA